MVKCTHNEYIFIINLWREDELSNTKLKTSILSAEISVKYCNQFNKSKTADQIRCIIKYLRKRYYFVSM